MCFRDAVPILILLFVLSACERPFVDEAPPRIEVTGADFSRVFTEPRAAVRISASSFRNVQRVEINGAPATYDADAGRWEDTLHFTPGLNTFRVAAFDETDLAGMDTLYAVYLPFRFSQSAPRFQREDLRRGGHAATRLLDERVLLTGGAAEAGGTAEADAFLTALGSTSIGRFGGMNTPRTGHTATLLPDGRVLILGGSFVDDPASVDQLVETAELFDPRTMSFQTIPAEGPPVRRTLHTASVRTTSEGYRIDLFGGRGLIRTTPEERLGTRSDRRTFLFRDDTLFAESPALGFPAGLPLAGHTQSPLSPLEPGEPGSYLLAGRYFPDEPQDPTTYFIDLALLQETGFFDAVPAPPFQIPRMRHAAAPAGPAAPGLLFFFGGRQASPAQTLNTAEVFVTRAGQFFRFPSVDPAFSPQKRYGHTATFMEERRIQGQTQVRILIAGGFSPEGAALSQSEYLLVRTD